MWTYAGRVVREIINTFKIHSKSLLRSLSKYEANPYSIFAVQKKIHSKSYFYRVEKNTLKIQDFKKCCVAVYNSSASFLD